MKYVTHSTVPISEIVKLPAGSIAYLELEPGAPASRVQNLLAGRARSAKVRIRTRTKMLLDTEEVSAVKVIRVEVLEHKNDSVLQRD